MYFGPGQGKLRLPGWQSALCYLAGLDINNGHVFLIVCMNVGRIVLSGRAVHPDYDSIKHRDCRHLYHHFSLNRYFTLRGREKDYNPQAGTVHFLCT